MSKGSFFNSLWRDLFIQLSSNSVSHTLTHKHISLSVSVMTLPRKATLYSVYPERRRSQSCLILQGTAMQDGAAAAVLKSPGSIHSQAAN